MTVIPKNIQAKNVIKEAIIKGNLLPGDRLVVSELASSWTLGKTPVREALLLLSNEGYVSFSPNVGCQVSSITIQELHDLRVTLTQVVYPELRKLISVDFNEVMPLLFELRDIVEISHDQNRAIETLFQLIGAVVNTEASPTLTQIAHTLLSKIEWYCYLCSGDNLLFDIFTLERIKHLMYHAVDKDHIALCDDAFTYLELLLASIEENFVPQ